MAIPIGGGVDDDLQAFGTCRRLIHVAVQGADIGCGRGRRTALAYLIEFIRIIIRKEDVVVAKIEAAGLGSAEPDQR